MRPSLLLIVESDPRQSARPAEAIRIAAGVAAWKKAEVTLYLRGPAIRALGEWVDDLKEEDNFTRYLPLLAESGRSVLAQAGAPELADLGESPVKFEVIDDHQLATRAAGTRHVMRF
jgi:hypothetical protein